MKKKTAFIILLILLLSAAMIFFLRSRKKESRTEITTTKAHYGYIASTVTATGTVQPVDTVSVGAQVSGVVQSVYADYNSEVKTGQLLATIDPAIISAQVSQSRAALNSAQSNLQYQDQQLKRQSALYDLGAISKAEYQLAVNQHNLAEASVANANAQLKLVERNLYYTRICSPINGVVLNRNISAGQTIASSFNAPTLFVIARDLSKMQVRASVDEADIGEVQIGQYVQFTVDAFPDDVFEGKVEQILLHPTVSSNVVTYTTIVTIDNSSLKLKPGMTANITIYIREDMHALLVPVKALNVKADSVALARYHVRRLKMDNNNDTVANASSGAMRRSRLWIRSGDTLSERSVLTSITDNTWIKIDEGLHDGEEVVTAIAGNGNKSTAANQKSPFMPQMPPRRSGAPRN